MKRSNTEREAVLNRLALKAEEMGYGKVKIENLCGACYVYADFKAEHPRANYWLHGWEWCDFTRAIEPMPESVVKKICCADCGKAPPGSFGPIVSSEVWKAKIPRRFRNKVLCKTCMRKWRAI